MMEASPSSTRYKAQRARVGAAIGDAERHFLGTNVDQSYEDQLGEMIENAEVICEQKDQELDIAQKAITEVEQQKKDLLAILPKGLGQKFSGDAGSWPSFRQYFVRISKQLEPTVAAATMKQLINCPKLKKSTKPLRTGQEVLDELDRQLGHSFLNSQAILNEVNRARPATNKEEENALVTMFRHAKTSLEMQDDPMAEQQLLTATLLISWSQLLLDSSQKDFMKILQASNFGKSEPAAGKPSMIEEYFSYIEDLDERISVAIRHRAAKNPGKPRESGHKDDSRRSQGGGNARTLRGAYETTPQKNRPGCKTF